MKKKIVNKKIGLALGSGAFRGFAHLGVIKALNENNIPIDYISGSSVGSLVAAYYALYGEVDSLRDKLINGKNSLLQLADLGFRGGLVSGRKYEKLVESLLGNSNFSDTILPLRIVATELSSGQPIIFSEGSLAAAVRASCSVPIVFEPAKNKRQRFIDGALSSPVPVDILRSLGADEVIAVNLYHKNEFVEKKFTLTKVALRSTRIALYNLAQYSSQAASVLLNPDISIYMQGISPRQYFSPQITNQVIKIGYKEAYKHMSIIQNIL